MIDAKDYHYRNSYFAAANGYSGFRSYFDTIFTPEKIDYIFVLKGGPGTGKSTLMKKVLLHSAERGYLADAIFCSSDPNSLDGVILRKGERTAAVVDGTAPHERDAIIPCVSDELVNLADGLNKAWLDMQKEDIMELVSQKKKSYKSAYTQLHKAGEIASDIMMFYMEQRGYNKAESDFKLVTNSISQCDACEPQRYIKSAFGAGGYVTIQENDKPDKVINQVSGDGISEHIVMRKLYEFLLKESILSEVWFSPFSENIIERVATEKAVWTLSVRNDLSIQDLAFSGEIEKLLLEYESILLLAQESFKSASSKHFELEAIYSSAIDFSRNDRISESICSKIDDILCV